jgi:hypothetical protein
MPLLRSVIEQNSQPTGSTANGDGDPKTATAPAKA